MPYCSRCGEWNDEDAAYCSKCGRRLESRSGDKCSKCGGRGKVFSGMPRINWGVAGIDEHGYVTCSECGGSGKKRR